MIKKLILGISLFIFSNDIQAKIFSPTIYKLENGMTVIIVRNTISKTVKVGFAVAVGDADDPYEVFGISHFLEHLFFQGSKNYPDDSFRRLIVENGGQTNAYTSHDNTVYYTSISSDKLELMFKLYSDVLKNLEITDKKVKTEIGVVMAERQLRYDSTPFGTAIEAYRRAIYHQHPYGFPTIGYPHHIKNYTRKAAQDHFDKYYKCPANITLIISGDCEPERALKLAKQYFGDIPAKEKILRKRPQELDRKGIVMNIEQKSKRIAQINYLVSYHSPNHSGKTSKYFYPLLLLEQIMSGNVTMRLYNQLVRTDSLATAASLRYDSNSYDNADITISLTLAPGKKLDDLKNAITKMVDNIRTELVSEAELEQAKRDIIAELAYAKDGNSKGFDYFTLLSIGFTTEEIENWPDNVKKVTREQILEAAKFVFDKKPVATMTVYPADNKHKR